MTTSKRILFFIIIIFSQAIYLPLNKHLQGGIALKIPLDELVPIISGWSIPYLLWMFCWFWLCLWAALKMPDNLIKTFWIANLLVILSAMLVYTFFPTFVDRPPVQGFGLGPDVLRWIYSRDGLYNAFPSGHIYLATLTCLFYSRWYPQSRWFWALIFLVVACSTLFTGQHYILDVVGGLVFALVGVYLAIKLNEIPKLIKNKSTKETVSF
jgi:membrane-associated phospholipid phosphatase